MQGLQRGLLTGLCLLLGCAAAQADVPLFRQLGAAQGLPSERVYALAQDEHGCLWVGTADGLARFDGARFEVFHHDPQRAASLPANVVQSLHRDAGGRLWAGFEGGGLAEIREHGAQLQRWAGPQGLDAEADVWAIGSTVDGQRYFGGFGTGLVRFDPDSGERRAWGSGQGLLSEHLLAIAGDPRGGLWIGGLGGLQFLDGDRLSTPPASAGLPAGPVFGLGFHEGELWVGARAGVFRRRAERFEPLAGAAPGPVLSVAGDAEGALWIGRLAGLELLPASGASRPALPAQQRSGQRSVFDLLRDHEDGLWVASDGGGLLHLPPRWRRFRSWTPDEGGLSATAPSAAAFDASGQLWHGGGDGRIERIDPDSGLAREVLQAGSGWPDQQVNALLVHRQRLWIGTRRGFVLQPLAPPGASAQVFAGGTEHKDSPRLGVIDHFLAAADGSVWLSSHGGGIEQRDADGRLLQRFDETAGLGGLDTEQMRFGPDGGLWVAGGDGLQRLDPHSARFVSLPVLAGERAFGFAFTGDGRLWVARRRGLVALESAGGDWTLTAQLPLLAGIEVGGLAADAQGQLWASSARGLWRIDPASGLARRFGVRDGLPGQEFSDRPLAESVDRKTLAAVLPQALVQIDSALFQGAPSQPRLRLDPLSLRRDGEALQLPLSPALELRHDDREIRFAARVSSFIEPDAWRYRMRLDPFDPEWVQLDAGGQRIFPLLPAGEYRLQVAAAGPDGRWHANPPLALSVAPPWWELPGARLAQAALLGLLLLGLYRLHRRRLAARAAAALAESQQRWALQASEQKSQFLATLAHEIRTPMTGLLGMAELLAASELDAEQRRRLGAVQQSGALLRRLVDDALDLARIEAGRLELRPRPTALRALCQQTLENLAASAAAKGLVLDFEFDADLPAQVQVDPERLQQILLNLLGNAIKFSDRGAIRLRVRAAPAQIQFDIEDRGAGIDPAQRARLLRRFEQADGEDTARRHGGAGLGLAICSELAEAMGGSLALDARQHGGTRARLLLPRVPIAHAVYEGGGDPTAAPPRRGDSACLRLLLVEDDPLAAETVLGLLRQLGHQPVHAPQALAALSECALATFDAALLDLDLPGMDGLQLAGLLRAGHPDLPLIALTARSDPGLADRVREAGMRQLLRKPTGAAELAQALGRLAGQDAAGC